MEVRVRIDDIDKVLFQEVMEPFNAEVSEAFARGVDRTMDELVANSKASAPVDDGRWERKGFPNHRKHKGHAHGYFAKKIASKKAGAGFSHSAMWYVKGKEASLTHLLVHGHEQFIFGKDTGKFTQGTNWLHNAREEAVNVIDKYIAEEIEKVVK